jgi:hypothetical protein
MAGSAASAPSPKNPTTQNEKSLLWRRSRSRGIHGTRRSRRSRKPSSPGPRRSRRIPSPRSSPAKYRGAPRIRPQPSRAPAKQSPLRIQLLNPRIVDKLPRVIRRLLVQNRDRVALFWHPHPNKRRTAPRKTSRRLTRHPIRRPRRTRGPRRTRRSCIRATRPRTTRSPPRRTRPTKRTRSSKRTCPTKRTRPAKRRTPTKRRTPRTTCPRRRSPQPATSRRRRSIPTRS